MRPLHVLAVHPETSFRVLPEEGGQVVDDLSRGQHHCIRPLRGSQGAGLLRQRGTSRVLGEVATCPEKGKIAPITVVGLGSILVRPVHGTGRGHVDEDELIIDVAGIPFYEIHIDTPVAVCEERDPKGLYKKARSGEIPNFTGISDPYEAPENPEVLVDTSRETVDESGQKVLDFLKSQGLISF